jgi:CRP-like cAMP-binding protein
MSRQIGEIPTRSFNAGDVIFRAGDDAKGEAFLVHQGRVEIRITFGTEDRIVNTLNKGQLLGEFALWRDAPRSATAIALEPVTLMVIPANRLDHMVRSNGALAVALIRDLANRMLAAEERMRTSEGRIQAAETRAEAAEARADEAERRARDAENRAAKPA